MKTRSASLHSYLLRANVLDGPPEAIARAKRSYRKQYKRLWKQHRDTAKEIRFEVTAIQLEAIKSNAQSRGMRHTAFVKTVVLESASLPAPLSDRLLKVLQLVSMAVIASSHDSNAKRVNALLQEAETILLQYLKCPGNE